MGKPNRSKTKVSLNYTRKEWIDIERAIVLSGKRNGVISYIIEGANKLDLSDYISPEENKKHFEVKQRQFHLPPNCLKTLSNLSEKLGIPRSTIVARLIINPLLKNE